MIAQPHSFALAAHVNRQLVRRLAGSTSFHRGEDYFGGGHVRSLEEHRGAVVAKVDGTETYRVRLWLEKTELAYSCSCPASEDGSFCKHCVAVGLAVVAGRTAPEAKPARKAAITLDDVRAFLDGLEKQALVDLLMNRAMYDGELQHELFVRAATDTKRRGVNVAAIRETIDRVVDIGDFVDWRGARSYVGGVEDLVDSLEKMHGQGHSVELVDLIEHALARVERAIEQVDDSDGEVGGLLQRLQQLHHTACEKANVDRVALARRLFAWELRSGYDVFAGAASTYADVLGEAGLREYRKLAEAEWKKVPSLGPNQKDADQYGRRYRITAMMEGFARRDGSLDALVQVRSRDLSSPYSFLRVAELFREAKDYDRARSWAEKGLKAFPGHRDTRLRQFLAEEYQRARRGDDAIDLVWQEFVDRPSLETFKSLKSYAQKIRSWDSWRDKALAHVRADIRKRSNGARSNWFKPDRSLLVEIFLWEKDVEAAWTEARAGGCNASLWFELARHLEKDEPAAAAEIYAARIEPTIGQMGNHAYQEAVRLLQKMRLLFAAGKTPERFDEMLAGVRERHARKRNFIRLLDRARWS
jgi:uncharacterized Zn finger protein